MKNLKNKEEKLADYEHPTSDPNANANTYYKLKFANDVYVFVLSSQLLSPLISSSQFLF